MYGAHFTGSDHSAAVVEVNRFLTIFTTAFKEDMPECRKDIDLVTFTLCRPINTFSFSLQDVVETGDLNATYVGKLMRSL